MDYLPSFLLRRLQDDAEDAVSPDEGETLRNTVIIYGSIYALFFLFFSSVRRHFPKTFRPRSVNPKYHCKLAEEKYGHFSWMYRLLLINEDDILEQCGMDALCFLRILSFGSKMACLGILNSAWLFPIYATSPETEENDYITDGITKLSATYVPPSNGRLIATCIATWIVFLFAMHLLLKDFEWFTAKRHLFLSKTLPRNYTIYIAGICDELRTSAGLENYFKNCFGDDSVLEAHVAMDIPNLEKKVAKRESLVSNLEHAINVQQVLGKTPMHKVNGVRVNSIDAYTEELRQLNEEINEDVARIEAMHDPELIRRNLELQQTEQEDFSMSAMDSMWEGTSLQDKPNENSSLISSIADESTFGKHVAEKAVIEDAPLVEESDHTEEKQAFKPDGAKEQAISFAVEEQGDLPPPDSKTSLVKSSMAKMSNVGTAAISNVGTAAVSMFSNEDGKYRQSGFVTFTKLTTTHAARQMIHHHTPFTMHVAEAPAPHDIYWHFVGMPHKAIKSGQLTSYALATVLCLFWTIPVSFIASLTDLDALRESWPWLDNLLENNSWLEQLFAQLAPLFIVGLNAVLPYILLYISMFELPISSSIVEASLFVKLSIFMVIQTFFVSAISGSIFTSLDTFINDPSSAVDLLANSLPQQAIYFVQILLVSCVLGQTVELLNLGRWAVAKIRSWVGPTLTEKERNTPWMGLITLVEPWEMMFGIILGLAVLYFMVTFVYSAMTPITNYFLLFCFTVLKIGWTNQFIYVYPPIKDSGGQLWIGFVSVAITCMIIAQFVLLGWFGIKKAPVSAGLMVPLIVITFIFNFYIRQEHFVVAENLPTGECIELDYKNMPLDYSFVRDKYKQAALVNEDLEPENAKEILFQDAVAAGDEENQGRLDEEAHSA